MQKIIRILRREILLVALLALPFILAAVWWNKIPPTVVTHWDLHGRPNGWMPKAFGLLATPVINIAMCLLLAWIPQIDPRLQKAPERNTAPQRRIWRLWRLAMGGFLSAISVMILVCALGWRLDVGRIGCDGTLILMAILGNPMGNLAPNYLAGVRTPWTLEDPGTWRATHRVAGRALVFGSLAVLVIGLFVSDAILLGLLFTLILAIAVGSLGYSAWYFQRHAAASR